MVVNECFVDLHELRVWARAGRDTDLARDVYKQKEMGGKKITCFHSTHRHSSETINRLSKATKPNVNLGKPWR